MYSHNHSYTWIATAVLALVQNSLQAAVIYGVQIDQFAVEAGPSSTAVSASLTNQGGSLDRTFFQPDIAGNYSYEQASASAGPGGLRSNSQTVVHVLNANNIDSTLVSKFHNIESVAAMTIDDFIITGLGTAPVLASLNLDVSGGLGFSVFTQNGNNTNGATGNATLQVQGFFLNTSNTFIGIYSQTQRPGSGLPASSSGILTGFNGSGSVTTTEALLPVNTPFSVNLGLVTSASSQIVNTEGDTLLLKIRIAEASASYSNTLTFALDGPVFNLPAGYSIGSVSANIFNNQYVVPVPAAVWLFGSALFGLVGISRKRSVD